MRKAERWLGGKKKKKNENKMSAAPVRNFYMQSKKKQLQRFMFCSCFCFGNRNLKADFQSRRQSW